MANVRKRILELTALESASLNTTIVGVDGGTTYKIELDTLADAVTARVNILDRDRLQSLESVTSSFETKGRNVVSSSAQISNLGFISSSVNITSLNTFTQSIDNRVDNLEAATSSYLTSLNGAVSASSQLTSSYDGRYVLSGSVTQTTWDNIANKPNGIVSQSTDLSSLNAFTQSIDSRVDSLENSTGSYLTNLNGAISSSSQLTSSFDVRYTLSGSITETTWNNISGKPSGIVSQSTDLTSLNQFTQSIDGRVDSLENATSSFETKGSGIISGAAQITSLGYAKLVGGNTFYNEQTFLNNVNIQGNLSSSVINSLNSFTQSFSTSVDSRFDTLEATIISGSPNYVQVLGNKRTNITTTGVSIISGSITTTGNPVQIMVTGDANPIGGSGWARLQIFRDGNGIGNIIQVENSSNLNVPYCLNVIDTPSAGTYTYSMRTTDNMAGTFDFGEHTGPLLTAVELKTNTNLPSTNNVFTGTNTFTGPLNVSNGVGSGGGAEGGQIDLAYAQTGTTLTGSAVALDVYQDRVRIFENSGSFRGVHIDMSKAPTGVAGELIWKSSGMVGAGTFVTLDNLKCAVTTVGQGNRGLSIGAVSTTFEADVSGWYTVSGGSGGLTGNNQTYTTTASNSLFNWNFPTHGDMAQVNLRDKTNNRFYRITMMIGAGYISNFISIERLF
jgi:hypothetical protein